MRPRKLNPTLRKRLTLPVGMDDFVRLNCNSQAHDWMAPVRGVKIHLQTVGMETQ
jgi:hypothetical protein